MGPFCISAVAGGFKNSRYHTTRFLDDGAAPCEDENDAVDTETSVSCDEVGDDVLGVLVGDVGSATLELRVDERGTLAGVPTRLDMDRGERTVPSSSEVAGFSRLGCRPRTAGCRGCCRTFAVEL